MRLLPFKGFAVNILRPFARRPLEQGLFSLGDQFFYLFCVPGVLLASQAQQQAFSITH